jgi:hypothetical protein
VGDASKARQIVVDVEALARFDDELARLLDDLTGTATLEPVAGLGGHGSFSLTVTLDLGKGALSGSLATRYHEARLTFDGVEIDQSHLGETRRALRAFLRRAPEPSSRAQDLPDQSHAVTREP